MAEAPERKWLLDLLPHLLASQHHGELLLGLDLALYNKLYRAATRASSTPPSAPHQLRHGGASADALRNVGDLALQSRAAWASTSSVPVYRQPAPYLRHLTRLLVPPRALAAASPTKILGLIAEVLPLVGASPPAPKRRRKK